MNDGPCMVSVLCTAFNHENYIRQTLESFLMQKTNFRFEVLINDDCSTDGTAAIIREYEEKYPEIIRPFYQEKNLFSQGMGVIYHTVLYPAAQGRYFAYCEGDDCWTDPEKLQLQVDFMESHPEYTACVHNTQLLFCTGREENRLLREVEEDHDVGLANIIRGMESSYHTSSLLVRSEYLKNLPDYYDVGASYGFLDHPMAFWFCSNGPIRFLNRTMSMYRIDSGASAWSSGVHGQYAKLCRFINGKIALLKAFKPYSPEEFYPLIEEYILRHEFELMYIEGRDMEQRKAPYSAFLKEKPFSYRCNNFIKAYFPWIQKLYRGLKGYHE